MLGALVLAGCSGTDGPPEPPDLPTSAAPLDDERLELVAQLCGGSETSTAPIAFAADESAWLDGADVDGMTVAVAVTLTTTVDHGEHAVDPTYATGTVTDPDGVVVGVVTALTGTTDDRGDTTELRFLVTLGSCDGASTSLGDPLPDGGYRLTLSGPVTPTDHDHAQGESWASAPLTFAVTDGDLATS